MKAHIRQCQCAQALYPTVFAVQPGRGGSCEEELASVGVGAAVRHREHIPRNKERKKQHQISAQAVYASYGKEAQSLRLIVLELEVFVLEFHAVNRLATGAVARREIPSL